MTILSGLRDHSVGEYILRRVEWLFYKKNVLLTKCWVQAVQGRSMANDAASCLKQGAVQAVQAVQANSQNFLWPFKK